MKKLLLKRYGLCQMKTLVFRQSRSWKRERKWKCQMFPKLQTRMFSNAYLGYLHLPFWGFHHHHLRRFHLHPSLQSECHICSLFFSYYNSRNHLHVPNPYIHTHWMLASRWYDNQGPPSIASLWQLHRECLLKTTRSNKLLQEDVFCQKWFSF